MPDGIQYQLHKGKQADTGERNKNTAQEKIKRKERHLSSGNKHGNIKAKHDKTRRNQCA